MALTALTGAQETGSRSYVFDGVVGRDDCKLLPQKSFEILPSLSRAGTRDRLIVKCGAIADGTTLLTLTFLLTDTPPALQRGERRDYSFRWGAKIAGGNPTVGEFTRDQQKCNAILRFLLDHASAKQPAIGPTWVGGCYHEDRWGTAMEITVTEATR